MDPGDLYNMDEMSSHDQELAAGACGSLVFMRAPASPLVLRPRVRLISTVGATLLNVDARYRSHLLPRSSSSTVHPGEYPPPSLPASFTFPRAGLARAPPKISKRLRRR